MRRSVHHPVYSSLFLVELTILVELRVALPVAIDILPGFRVDEGELIRHGSYNWAIFEVQLMNVKRPSTTEKTPYAVDLEYWSACDAKYPGAGSANSHTGEILAKKGPGYLDRGWK